MQKGQTVDRACCLAAKDGTWLNTPSPPPEQAHLGTREMWAILHRADEVLNLRVTQAEVQNTTACPSYQMTWNSARSSAITAGSLTMREQLLPGCWTRASSRSPGPSTHSHPHRDAAPIPLHGTASKCLVFFEFCTLTPSSTYLFFICVIKKRFQRPGTSKRGKIMKHPSQGINMKVRLDVVSFLSFYLGCYINNTQH